MRLYRKSRVTTAEIDTVKASKKRGDERRAIEVLMDAQAAWVSMTRYREERERNKRFCYGDQWGDVVRTETGEEITEAELLRRQGCLPMKNNLIRRLVRRVKGFFLEQETEMLCVARDREEQVAGETMTTLLEYIWEQNEMKDILSQSLEELLISGLVVNKKTFGWREGVKGCWTEYVQPNDFFIDPHFRDNRGWDINIIGEIHDVSFKDVAQRFARSAADYVRLAEIYDVASRRGDVATYWEQFGEASPRSVDFFVPTNPGLCRVIEVWRKETKPRYRCHDLNSGELYKIEVENYHGMVEAENERRIKQGTENGMGIDDIPLIEAEWMVDTYWYNYWLSPFGDILQEGETPYAHGSHPYVFRAVPLIDGEVHSFVGDIIDQQKYVNRMVMMQDWIMRASAKGALLIPEDSLGDKSPQDFGDAWVRPNAVITYKPSKSGHKPEQVSANSTNIGVQELLNIQLKLFEDISGVNGALQGKPGFSGESAAHAAQQVAQGGASLADTISPFNSFLRKGARIDVKNAQQCYTRKEKFKVVGRDAVVYDPDEMSDIDFDLSIAPSRTGALQTELANEMLMKIWERGEINLQMLLKVGNFPFADKLLQAVEAEGEKLANGNGGGGLPPELLAQAQQGANMEAVAQAYGGTPQQ